MTTTAEIIGAKRNLKPYRYLEIKRRYSTGYEASWYDITQFLLDKGEPTIRQSLDVSEYSWGQFKTSDAKFKINNNTGIFFPPNYPVSLFSGTVARQYTKVRYRSGYKDENGTPIDETVFEGLLNEKTIVTKFNTGETGFSVLGYDIVMRERKTTSSQFTGSKTAKQIIASLMSDTYITNYITYAAGNINPDINTTFDDTTEFNDKTVATVLTDVCKKCNSVWYINSSNALIVVDRTFNANTPHRFVGGYNLSKDANIIDIKKYDEGYKNLINYITYNTGSTIYAFTGGTANLDKYGTNTLALDGADLTTFATIETLCDQIIADFKEPKRRITLKTIYSPNVYTLFDVATIEWYGSKLTDDIMIWNFNYWNDGKYYMTLNNNFFLDATTEWIINGWNYNVRGGTMDLYLIEK